VTGQCGSHGYVGGFLIANLSNHQHLWILPNEWRAAVAKVSPRVRLPRSASLGKDLFNRIFDSDNMASAQTGEIRRHP